MLIPHQQAVEVLPTSGANQRFEGLKVLEAGPEFPGLQLQLAEIWVGCGLIASPPAGCTHTVKADAQVEGYWSSDEIIPISSEGASEQLLGQLLSGVYVAVLANCPSAAGPEVEAAQQLVRSIRLRGGGLTLSASGFGVGGSQSESVAMPPGVRLYALFRGDLRGMLKALEDGITTLLGLTSAGANVSPVPIDKATCLEHLIQPGLPVHWYVGGTAGDQRAAAAAGYRFVAAGYGYGGDLDAVHRISSPLELLQLSLSGLPW